MSLVPTRIVIFAKAPVPGMVKTRLIPALGPAGAATLAREMLADTIASARAAGGLRVEVCASPHPDDPSWAGLIAPDVERSEQVAGNLGERLAAAAARILEGGSRLLLVGTDCPELDGARLAEAARLLEHHDAVIFPALDGGYVLLGLAKWHASLFHDIPWSTDAVAEETKQRILALGWSLHEGDPLRDIDEPSDMDFYLSRKTDSDLCVGPAESNGAIS